MYSERERQLTQDTYTQSHTRSHIHGTVRVVVGDTSLPSSKKVGFLKVSPEL